MLQQWECEKTHFVCHLPSYLYVTKVPFVPEEDLCSSQTHFLSPLSVGSDPVCYCHSTYNTFMCRVALLLIFDRVDEINNSLWMVCVHLCVCVRVCVCVCTYVLLKKTIGLLHYWLWEVYAWGFLSMRGRSVTVCYVCLWDVWDSVSEGVLTAVRMHAPLQLLQLDPEEHPLPTLSLEPPAPPGASETPPSHKGSVRLSSNSLLPPIKPIICLFFQASPGRSVPMLPFQYGSLAEGNLWRAAVDCSWTCCLTSSPVQLSWVPVQASLHPCPAVSLQLPLWAEITML